MAPSAVLDACVLYPVSLRDTLLNMAEAGLFRVLWTEEILVETVRNIVRETPGLTAEHLEKTFAAMRRAFPDAMISGYEPLIEAMTDEIAAVLRAQAARKRHPPMSVDEMLDRLAITVPRFAAAIRSVVHR